MNGAQAPQRPVLLFNDECGVCRWIARWVVRSDRRNGQLVVRPIGDDPAVLRALNPALDIWDAYATIHLLLPDGTMKLGGEAVAGVLEALPGTRWSAGLLRFRVFGVRPFQGTLNLAYEILSDVRPLFGCESCGQPAAWMKPFAWAVRHARMLLTAAHPRQSSHFTARPSRPREV